MVKPIGGSNPLMVQARSQRDIHLLCVTGFNTNANDKHSKELKGTTESYAYEK